MLTSLLAFANNGELFPETKGWTRSEKIDTYSPDNLWNKINGAADGYLTYNFQNLQVADYTRENDDYISVEIYEHANPVMAFGIYSSERPSDARYNDTGAEGYELDGMFNFFADRYYVKIYTPVRDEASTKAIREIANGIAIKIGGSQAFPSVVQCFPSENQRPHSTIFVAKNFMGYGFFKSAFVTTYKTDCSNHSLFIIEAKDEETTESMLSSYFKLQKVDADNLNKGEIVVPDLFNGDIPLMWDGNFIWGIQNGADLKNPYELLEKISLNLKNNNLIK
jgi:hypothetical protein